VARSPSLVAAAAVLAVLVFFAAKSGGFSATTWYPGAVFLLAVLVLALLVAPRLGSVPRVVAAAVVLLWLYAAWSYLSISWAGQKGDAWDGANRTVLYAIAFSLFALWPMRARAAAVVMGAFALAVAGIGLIELLRANGSAHPLGYFIDARFAQPAGYPNADVAMWFTWFFPSLTLASRREVPPPLRGVFMASASLLGGLALMGQTRGWLFAAPVVIVLYLVISRDRVRTAVALVAVLAAAAVYRVPVEAVHNAFAHPAGVDAALSHATSRLLWTSLVLGILTAGAAYADRRLHVPAPLARRANAGLAVGIALAIGVGVVLLVASQGHPVRRVESAWNDFKRGPEPTGSEARFKFSLGSQRYDYWRVSWDQFRAHPLGGIGADNFQEIYLQKRHSDETPLYPHSIVFRTIAQTGIVGVLLLGGMLACALVAAWRATRRRRGLGAATAAGAVTGFLYWAAHGSVDWFWEFPALGVGAFAMLGLAASLLPRPAASRAAIEPISAGRPAWAAAGVAAVVIGLGLLSQWMAARAARDAARSWPSDLAGAFDDLDTASKLNPISPQPELIRASIAQRVGLADAARKGFLEALDRDPRNTYAVLELGAMAAEAGRRGEATAWLTRMHTLNPRDDLGPLVLSRMRAGKPISAAAVNNILLTRTRKLGQF
jgi:O-antigen ligase/polysaccharide polymerase Wzy-like membrane protein